jgi:sugar lactone lactonase YvrE
MLGNASNAPAKPPNESSPMKKRPQARAVPYRAATAGFARALAKATLYLTAYVLLGCASARDNRESPPVPDTSVGTRSSAPVTDRDRPVAPGIPETIVLNSPALYPETVVHDEVHDRFLVGSMRNGGIYSVTASGAVARIVDDERLCSVLGIAVDARRKRIVAVTSDLGVSTRPSAAGPKKLAALGIYDLDSGRPLHYVDLAAVAPAGAHLLNGLALDPSGNAYVTDSFSPIVYKVDAAGQASILLKDGRFEGPGINLNGLVVHPEGYLLLVKKSDGSLFKLPLSEPASLSRVQVDESFRGGDGLVLTEGGELVLIANEVSGVIANAAYAIQSNDHWVTATVQQRAPLGDVYPTTAALHRGHVYALHSQLKELLQGPDEQRSGSLRQATLQPIARIGAHVDFLTPDSSPGRRTRESEAGSLSNLQTKSPKAFVYAELQLATPFARAPWQEINAEVAQQPGFLNATWLAGIGNTCLGGLYAFDSVEHARRFVTSYFPDRARKLGAAQTTRLFDGTVTEEASRDMSSVHFGGKLERTPGAFVYTEVQVNVPFSSVPWRLRNPAIRSNRGFLAKTWLSGLGTNTVGGLYAFDTIENAKAFAFTFFAGNVAKQGMAFSTRVFDGLVVQQASQAANSPFYLQRARPAASRAERLRP